MPRQHVPHTKMSTKKKVAAASAAVLIAALLLGGAFAWTDFSQAFKNLFHGTATPDVLLHDDFAPGKNKDVYVENTGETDLVVRVQFAEFLQVGNDVKIGTDAKDASTWRVRQWAGTTIGSDGTIPATDNYHIWLMSGEQKWYLPGTSEIGDVEYTGAVTGGNGNTTEETLGAAPVVLLTEYQAHPENYDPATGFWILDDTADGNGWCYWSKLLPAGKATNLLLDNVTLDPENKPDDNYAYNIDVRLQAANKTEAYKLADKGDISDAAQELTHDLAADVIKTAPDGKLVKNISGNIWEELDDNGNSQVPRQFIYDGDGSIGKDKEYSGDELACDRNGVIALAGGLFVKGTDNPNVFESVNQDGTSKNPKQYVFTPDKNPEDYVYDESPMVTGQDGLSYLKVDDTTYICVENGLVMITSDASTLPGGPDDVVQEPQWPSINSPQPIQFRVLSIPYQLPGSTYQTQVEFFDPSQEASAQPLRYVLSASAVGSITISSSGLVTVSSTAPENISFGFCVIAADGSFARGSITIPLAVYMPSPDYQASGITAKPVAVNKGSQNVLTISPTSTSGVCLNVISTTLAIQGSDLGCSLTSAGLFTAGDTNGTVMVQVTVSCRNNSGSPLSLQDGTGRTIVAGASYTMTTTFEVNVGDPVTYSAETKPYVTQLTLLGVTSWSDVEPAPEYASGNGSQGMPYQISSIRQLKKFVTDKGDNAGYGKYFVLTADMNVDNADVLTGTLLGSFYGTFDGGNHVIENLKSNSGLFSTVAYGTVKNLGRRSGAVNNANMAGTIAQYINNNGSLIRCYNETPITNGAFIGGLVYAAGAATIDNCYNKGALTPSGPTAEGGLVCFALADGGTLTIKNSYNIGAILGVGVPSGAATNLGGIGGIIGCLHNSVPNGQTVVLSNVRNYGPITRFAGSSYTTFGDIIGQILAASGTNGFQKVNFTNVSYLPGLISYTGSGVQQDTDIGDRAIAETISNVTISGSASNTLTGTQTGFLVP